MLFKEDGIDKSNVIDILTNSGLDYQIITNGEQEVVVHFVFQNGLVFRTSSRSLRKQRVMKNIRDDGSPFTWSEKRIIGRII